MNQAANANTYDLTDEGRKERRELHDAWAQARAEIGHQLLALLSAEVRPDGLRLWGELERAHERHAQQLQTAWAEECDQAFSAGLEFSRPQRPDSVADAVALP